MTRYFSITVVRHLMCILRANALKKQELAEPINWRLTDRRCELSVVQCDCFPASFNNTTRQFSIDGTLGRLRFSNALLEQPQQRRLLGVRQLIRHNR